MAFLSELWLPIVLSAVFVFVVSSIFHTLMSHHDTDFDKVPAEDEVMDALRKANVPPGDYVMPRPSSKQEMSLTRAKRCLRRVITTRRLRVLTRRFD